MYSQLSDTYPKRSPRVTSYWILAVGRIYPRRMVATYWGKAIYDCSVKINGTSPRGYSIKLVFLAATKQLMNSSVGHIIMTFPGAITIDSCNVHAKGQGQRSKVKVTEVQIFIRRRRAVTPAWIHRWLQNYAHSLQQYRRGVLLFFLRSSVRQGPKSTILTRIRRFRIVNPVWIDWWLRNYAQSKVSWDKISPIFTWIEYFYVVNPYVQNNAFRLLHPGDL